jgi:hypothetical protein
MSAIGNISRAIFITFLIGVATAAAGWGMGTALKLEDAPAATAETESAPVVYYHELKNLGNGIFLCEVWTSRDRGSTILKLGHYEKLKLQRVYGK